MKSRIYLNEEVVNKDRKLGASKEYYPLWVDDGVEKQPALFTKAELDKALERGSKNPEDMPDFDSWMDFFK